MSALREQLPVVISVTIRMVVTTAVVLGPAIDCRMITSLVKVSCYSYIIIIHMA